MSAPALGSGALRHRIAIEAPQEASDGMGGVLVTWHEVGKAWARLEPGALRPGERFDVRAAPQALRVRLRWRADLDRGMAIVLGARRLRVLGLHDPDGRRRFLVLDCVEER